MTTIDVNRDMLQFSSVNINNIKLSHGNGGVQVMDDAPKPEPEPDVDYFEYYHNRYYDHIVVGQGCKLNIPTKEKIAEYFGGVAKELDQVYSEGKLTKEEYDELNVQLGETVEKFAQNSEFLQGFYKYWNTMYNSPGAFDANVRRCRTMTPEERMEDMHAEINRLISRFFKIDRNSLWSMLNSYRNG